MNYKYYHLHLTFIVKDAINIFYLGHRNPNFTDDDYRKGEIKEFQFLFDKKIRDFAIEKIMRIIEITNWEYKLKAKNKLLEDLNTLKKIE